MLVSARLIGAIVKLGATGLKLAIAALFMAPVLNLLNDAYTIGSDGLPAPQANLRGAVAKGVFEGGLPWTIIAIGAGIAVVVIIIDSVLQHSGSKIRTPVMAFAVGVYLPFDLNVSIFLGGTSRTSSTAPRSHQGVAGAPRRGERGGLLAAAGFITGEALTGIGLAVPIAVQHNEEAIALFHGKYKDFAVPSIAFVVIVMCLLCKLALRKEDRPTTKGRATS